MAGKIPQTFIDDILERSDIVEIIDSRVKLKKTGRNYSARCPFHEEKTPSFSVNPDKQFYYCFGCGAGGNAISFLMDYDRTSFVESIENLARHLGVDVPREEISTTVRQQQETKRSIYDLLEQTNNYYQLQLLQHPQKEKAINYLKQRGLSGEITKHFGIGYAPPGWDNLLKTLGQTPEQMQQLIDAGMLIEKDDQSGSYDRFRDRLMFPIRDNRGRTIAFGGRVLNDEKPKYLNSPETAVFHKQLELYGLYEARQANRHLERLLMVEGYMDVVALAQYGITYAVATLGTSAGSAHMEKVFRHCSEVIFCFDGDEAGRKAAFRALEAVLPLMESGRQAKFLFLPEGEDPDSLIRNIGKDQFLWQMDKSQTLSEYLFSIHEKQLDLGRADDKAKLISNIMPHIQTLPAGALQEIILHSLSDKTGLPIDDIKNLSASTLKADEEAIFSDNIAFTRQPAKTREKLNNDSRKIKRTPARTAIALLVLNPTLATEKTTELLNNLENIDGDMILLQELLTYINEKQEVNTAKIIGYWQSHHKSAISRLLALEVNNENPEEQRKEYLEAIEQISKNKQREKHAVLIEKLKQNPNIRFDEMDGEERDIYLSIFQKKY